MFFFVALAIWAAMNTYVLRRVRNAIPVIPRWLAVTAGIFLAISYVLARILMALGFRATGVALEWIGAVWMGVLVIALGCFLIADLVTGFGLLLRAHLRAIRLAALAASIALSLASLVNAWRAPVVRDYEVVVPRLPAERDGMVVVALSDLHLGAMTTDRWLKNVIARTASLRPDLVVIAGDLTEGDAPPEREVPPMLSLLRAPLGVWAVPGNHQAGGSNGDVLLRRAGIRMLRDESVEVAPGVFLAGVDNAGHERVPGRGLVQRALEHVPRDSATILLSHVPEQTAAASRSGVALMIAGHTHAGQIWPFNYFVRIAYRYLGGRYDVGGMTLLVCRGTGTWGPPMRLFRPNEMLRIVLRRGAR